MHRDNRINSQEIKPCNRMHRCQAPGAARPRTLV